VPNKRLTPYYICGTIENALLWYGRPFYDRNMLDEIAKEKGFDPAVFAGVDEKPRNKLLSRRVKGHSNATEDNVLICGPCFR